MSRVTLDEVRGWEPAVDVNRAALAFGVSRASAYQAISDGTFPAKTIKVGHRLRVLTASIVEVLEGRSA